jgi:DNA repair exonuclease SbcCD ATPase subunit
MRVALLLLVGATAVTPVQKVIQLLSGMLEKGKQEKQEEQVQFAAYKQFCDDTTIEKQRAIKEANSLMEQLAASIQKAEADAATLAKEIAQLDEDISVWQGDLKASTEVREIENTDYMGAHKEYQESIEALDKAIITLKKQMKDIPQLTALAQVRDAMFIPEKARKVIGAFLAQGDELGNALQDEMNGAPEANAYEFQASGIFDMLEKLKDKFQDEKTDLEKEEMNARHAYEMLIQDLKAQISAATADREAKAQEKATKLQGAAEDKGTLGDTTATRDADDRYLQDLVSTCTQKSTDFENRQQLRSDELAAIEKAVEIMSSGAVSGNADKHLPSLVQKPPSFLQLSARTTLASPRVQRRLSNFLKQKAEEINSRVLSALAVHVSEDPFEKVKKMIKDLIVRLMEEANEEAEHKGWCDTELGTNEQTRKEKTNAVETLHSEIDELTATISKLGQEISDLSKELAEADKALAVATELRNKEDEKNVATIADAEEAQTAVSQAISVLREFYDKAAEAASLVQTKQPEIFDTPYTGMQSENGGVVGMLEVIQADFARLETDTKAANAEAQREFDEFSQETAVNRAANTKDMTHKDSSRTNAQGTLTSKKADLDGTQKELDAALSYYDKLKPSCVDAGVSYDDRVARRKEEIESLQEALRILNGEDIGFLQRWEDDH